jgi:hypothetical protein
MKRPVFNASLCVAILSFVVFSACTGGAAAVKVTLSTPGAVAIDQGQSVNLTATIANDSTNKGVTWALTGPGALSNVTTTSVTYTAPAVGTVPAPALTTGAATVTATSVADATKNGTTTITVSAVPAITTTSPLPAGTEGTAYNQTIAASGGAGTLTFSITGGALPAGLTLSGSGAITGTPTGPNVTSPFTVTVTDSSAAGAKTASNAFSITINLPPPPTITTTSLAAGVEGTAYSQTVQATGGLTPYTFSISVGSLPAGLSINAATGAITGTPTGPNGTANFTVQVADRSNPVQTGTKALSILINLPPAPTISPATLAAGVEGTPYNQVVTVNGGLAPFAWAPTGTLPAGLTGTPSAGGNTFTISGTPTGPSGTTPYSLQVKDSSNPQQSATQGYSITINLPPAPVISPAGKTLTGTIGTAFSQSFTVSGGLGPTFTWLLTGTLPAGLTGTPTGTTFKIQGTPTGPSGSSNVTLKVTDSSNPQQNDTQNYTITINNPPPPVITTTQAQVPTGTNGTAYSFTFLATGTGALTWSVSPPLTDNLSLNTTNGQITGTPNLATTVSFSLTVSDTFGQASAAKPFTITINNPPAPVITTTQALVLSGTVGIAYNFTFQATGTGTLTWSVSPPLTDNLSLNTTNGQITGTPNAQAVVSFNLTVSDTFGQASPATPFTITVSTIGISFTLAPPGSLNTSATANMTATVTSDPGTAGVDWTVTCGSASCGSFNPTHTASGVQTTYTAPPTVPTGNTVTIKAASTTQASVNVSAPVTITLPPLQIIFFQSPPNSLAVNATTNLSVTISNDPGTAGADWTVTCGNAGACGSFNLTHTASGVQTTYTAPSSVPTGNTVTIKATATSNPNPLVSAQVTITSVALPTCPLAAGGNEALLSGTYAILFNGWNDPTAMSQAAASFTANGSGTISSVVADPNGVGQTNSTQTGTGCYSVGSDRRGTMIFNFPGPNGGGVVFAIAVRSNGNGGRVIEFDDTTGNSGGRGSGQFKKQTPAAFLASTLSGNFGVGVRGGDASNNRSGVGAVFTGDGVSTISNGLADIEFASSSGPTTFIPNAPVTGTFTAPDATHGRGTVTLSVTVPGLGVLTLHFAYYVIDTTQMFIQSTDTPDTSGHSLQNGLMGKQNGPFSNASLNGSGVFSLAGVDPSPPHAFTDTATGLITSTGNGSFTGFLDQNVNGVVTQNNQAISGTVSIGANGLGTLTITSPAGIAPFTVVMFATNSALMLGGTATSPNNNIPVGILQAQSGGGTFTGASITGPLILGRDEPATTNTKLDVGAISIANPNFTITQDSSSQNGLQSGQVMSGTYTMTTNGRGVITIPGPNGGTAIIWLLQTNKAVILVLGEQNSAIINLDQ